MQEYKDFGAAKLADLLEADTLLILTSVDAAKINFGKPDEQSLEEVSMAELQKHIDDGQFVVGSMLLKTQVALSFLTSGTDRDRKSVV